MNTYFRWMLVFLTSLTMTSAFAEGDYDDEATQNEEEQVAVIIDLEEIQDDADE